MRVTLFLEKYKKMKRIHINFKKVFAYAITFSFLYYSFNQVYYSQRICSGEVTKKIVWTNSSSNEKIILTDEKTPLVISLIFKRGAIYLNDDRFPLYKELSGVDNFAKKTESGYVGQYSQHGLLGQQSNFNFRFNELTSMVYTENSASGRHIYENKDGTDSLKIEFVGSCKRKFI